MADHSVATLTASTDAKSQALEGLRCFRTLQTALLLLQQRNDVVNGTH
jgi:hypothetical protein